MSKKYHNEMQYDIIDIIDNEKMTRKKKKQMPETMSIFYFLFHIIEKIEIRTSKGNIIASFP